MTTADSPRAEVEIDESLVRRLLADQHPDLAELPIRFLAEGWDNAQYRIGDDLIMRMPRRAIAAPLIRNEQIWLPVLAPALTLPIPAPIRIGKPSERFGWPWSIVPWIDGEDGLSGRITDQERAGRDLGRFMASLHHPAPANAPINRFRGVPMHQRAEADGDAVATMVAAGLLDPRAREVYEAAVATPTHSGPPLWIHGDPHAGNIVIQNGRIASIIDWGDITSGDPASDLVCLWMVLDHEGREAAREHLPHDDHTWTRGRGWAVSIATMLLTRSDDRPDYRRLGEHTIRQVLA